MRLALPLMLFALVACAIAAFWWWAGRPIDMPPSPLAAGERLPCVSYAPFRRGQTPFEESTIVPPEQIDDDFARLKEVTSCVRLYAVDQGLDRAPELARKHGLEVVLGVWLGREPDANALQIEKGVALAKAHPETIRLIVVGNEALLRGEIAPSDLAAVIRAVRERVDAPVTYADVWEFWVKNRELADAVDVVTVHILPYWEDEPVAAGQAAAHLRDIRRFVGDVFPGKPILIGETGWPSQGRMRRGARPTPAEQAYVLHELVRMAKENGFDVSYVEAFDQPWKRILEGTVGGYWGLLDADTRQPKFRWGEPVSNHPDWPLRALGGAALAGCVFAAAAVACRGGALSRRRWLAIAGVALIAGAAIGLAMHMWDIGTRTDGEALRSALAIALAIATPIVAGAGIAGRNAPAPFAAVLAGGGAASRLSVWLGLLLAATAVVALHFALGLVFDPRYREFPASSLIGPVAGLGLAALLGPNGRSAGAAERVFAVALAICAALIAVRERLENFEALGLALVLLSLAGILWGAPAARARAAAG